MNQFTYNTIEEYRAALAVIQDLGVDYEAQPDELTIVTDELTPDEIDQMSAIRKPLNMIKLPTGAIYIQSCDEDEANIGINSGGHSTTYYHVNLPDLDRQWKPQGFNRDDIPADEFDRILAANKEVLLATIRYLNKTIPPLK